MTALQILAAGITHLCTPGPQTGWTDDIQTDLDRRDTAHRAVLAAVFGSDEWHTACYQRRSAETRIASALGITTARR